MHAHRNYGFPTGRRDLEDYVAIADIAAGAIQELPGTG
jgi:hypothetical protein